MTENSQLAALLQAVAAADADAVEQLLTQGVACDRYLPREFLQSLPPHLQQQPVMWQTAYSAVVANGNLELLRLLLDYGADPNGTAGGRLRPAYLQILCENDHFECFKLLLQRGADPNYYSGEGSDTITAVCQSGKLNYVEELILHGASLERVFREGLRFHNRDILDMVFKHGFRARDAAQELLFGFTPQQRVLGLRAMFSRAR